MPPLNPFKPEGELDSLTVRSFGPGLGITLDGVASNISVYGFHTMEIQNFE